MDKMIFAIDLGGTSIKLAFLTMEGEFLHKWEIPTDKTDNGLHIVEHIADAFHKKCEELHLSKEQFLGAGMGTPGPVIKGGIVSKAVNIGWENYGVKNELERHLSIPAFVENDANCAALGEMWKGAGKGVSELVFITLGTGVGGGIITRGDIVDGTNGGAGEVGHMTVLLRNGSSCNCGKKGCLETIASATGIVRIAKEKLNEKKDSKLNDVFEKNKDITAKDVFDLANQKDPIATEVVEKVSYYLGYALGTISSMMNPKAIILGGGVSKAGDTLLQPVRKYYEQFAFPATSRDTEIVLATLGNDAGAIGAGYLVKKGIEE